MYTYSFLLHKSEFMKSGDKCSKVFTTIISIEGYLTIISSESKLWVMINELTVEQLAISGDLSKSS